MAAQMRESSIPRCYDRAGYTVQQVKFIVLNYWQLAGGSKPERAAALGSGKVQLGPRAPVGCQELRDLEEAMAFLREIKPVYARAVDVFIDSGCDIKTACWAVSRAEGKRIVYRTFWGWLGRAYEWLSEVM